MALEDLKVRIARLPEQPGVYLFFDALDRTIYVGKASVLRDRVRSYLGAAGSSPKTDALLEDATRLEVIVTDSVVEALALENHLIKQRSPRFNILLRDDKNYPYLQLTSGEAFPRVLVARRVERDGHYYAGPFLPATFARRTMALTHKLFGIRSCNEVITGKRGRPCLEYDIGRCLAPCVEHLCSRDAYARAVLDARLFLEGRNDELVSELGTRMRSAAADERFEQAASLRDAIRTIEALRDRRQKMSTPRLGDRDAIGVHLGPAGVVVQVFQMRNGRVIDRVELASASGGAAAGTEGEVVAAAIQQFYEDHDPPGEIHVPTALPDADVIERWLTGRVGRRCRLVVPQRGEKRHLLELATRNAALSYESRFNEAGAAEYEALDELRAVLALPGVPLRIEAFDISTLQGSETVGVVVVCEGGRIRRSESRKFRVRGSDASAVGSAAGQPTSRVLDDFASMREVVLRRYRRVLEQGGPFPDLVLIDGGPGQLSAAYDALRAVGLENLVAVGLAKREELIYTRDGPDPIALGWSSPALRLVQRIRDEAHRFAVTYHRAARRRRDLTSALDAVPGVGPRRRRLLLTSFGSVAGVRRASRDELAAVVGPHVADAIRAHLPDGRG